MGNIWSDCVFVRSGPCSNPRGPKRFWRGEGGLGKLSAKTNKVSGNCHICYKVRTTHHRGLTVGGDRWQRGVYPGESVRRSGDVGEQLRDLGLTISQPRQFIQGTVMRPAPVDALEEDY